MHSSDFPANAATEFEPVPAASGAGAALQPGAQLGAYVIRRVLGEGGMGRVYLAEQMRPVRRDVALKLIREQVASPLARAYFDVERQALAQMQHPAIAQVFDAGTTADGHPYLVMEVVEGRPLTRFCSDEKLTRDERLALFARVCHGVQHAHQKGIIHRDLKPGNVLVRRVDGEPMPKIIDFGIAIGGTASDGGARVNAQATDHAGTAIYMSPEQSGREHRDIDTRSDVYALGVMLYEVLTDADAAALTSFVHRSVRAPHATLLAAIDSAGDAAGAAPTAAAFLQAARSLPAELRAILRKALAADRADRYDSAAALADDLERFRERRPVKALAQTRVYLARTFIARHRLGLAAASLAAAALLAGTGLALHGLARAQQSAALATVEAAKAAQVADFVRGMLAGIDPDRARSMDRSLMRLVLDSAAERAGRELTAQPAVRASIERTIADSYASLGERALAGEHYKAALDAARAAGAGRVELARLTMRNAENLDNQGKSRDAGVLGEQALALVAALPPTDRDRLYIESHLAGLECDAGKLDASRTRYLRVLDLQRREFGEDDEDTLASINGLAITDSDLARYDEARPLYETLIAHRRARYGDEHSKTLNAINGLAVLELEQKHFAAAEKLLGPQLPIYERVFGAEHPMTLRLVSNLGGAIRQQGRNEEARPYYERALALAQKLFGPRSPTTVMAEANLAALLRDAGQLAPAEQHARAAADNADAAFADNPFRAIIFKELATVLGREQRYADAERELDRAWRILSAAKDYGPSHPRSQEVVDAYVDLYAAWKKPEREAAWRARKTPLAANAGAP
jgi:non-specific serine/threonine protein kinase/serine/threonine-protein kinase